MKKINYIKETILAGVLTFSPIVAFADINTPRDLSDLIGLIMDYLNMALGLLMGVAVVLFVFYVVKYFILPNEDRKQAGNYVLYSVIGFFVILSFWGLVNIVQGTFGLRGSTGPGTWNQIENIFPR